MIKIYGMDTCPDCTYVEAQVKGNDRYEIIDQALIDEFAEVQRHQWDHCTPEGRERIWGLFGENDHLAHYEPLFLTHYTHAFHFPGQHTPTAEEVRMYYVPLIEELWKAQSPSNL